MVGEYSICPINWAEYYKNVEKALATIWDSDLDEVVEERLEELLRVEDISGYPEPKIQTWTDSIDNIDGICPLGASVAEVDWLKAQMEKLDKGTAL
jgi:hypothetical protein